MSAPPLLVGVIAFACVFGGALLGMLLQKRLPAHHLSADTKDVVKLGMGLVGTMAALALGLLLASAKSSYDAQSDELRQMSATILLLDRVLAHYGPEAKEARDLLREEVTHALGNIWSGGGRHLGLPVAPRGKDVFDAIEQLSPESATQRLLQAQILKIGVDLGRLRLMLFEEGARSMPMPFLVMLLFWLFTTKTGTYGTNYLQRALITAVGLGANRPQDAIYPTSDADAEGKPYDGANKYVMRFARGQLPPARAFWSLTMYDADFFFVANPLNRYTVSSRSKFKANVDGSIDVHVQHESPGKDKEANWLPAPQGKFILMLRMYWPREKVPSILDGSWKIPPVVQAN
jgi:hypothetical protein